MKRKAWGNTVALLWLIRETDKSLIWVISVPHLQVIVINPSALTGSRMKRILLLGRRISPCLRGLQFHLFSAAPLLLHLAAAYSPRVLLSLQQTAPVQQPTSVCPTCASMFFSRLRNPADDIELCWRHSSIHARWINHSCALRSPAKCRQSFPLQSLMGL